ncbi:hypothetical protein Tco_1360878 [Tanacetum coccineum]
MAERPNLDEDKGGKLIDPTRFRGMVGSLMYLSASRPDIVFAVQDCHEHTEKYSGSANFWTSTFSCHEIQKAEEGSTWTHCADSIGERLKQPNRLPIQDRLAVSFLSWCNIQTENIDPHGIRGILQSGIDDAECDPEKDILLLEAILNSEPLSPLPNHANYFPEVRKELKILKPKPMKPYN